MDRGRTVLKSSEVPIMLSSAWPFYFDDVDEIRHYLSVFLSAEPAIGVRSLVSALVNVSSPVPHAFIDSGAKPEQADLIAFLGVGTINEARNLIIDLFSDCGLVVDECQLLDELTTVLLKINSASPTLTVANYEHLFSSLEINYSEAMFHVWANKIYEKLILLEGKGDKTRNFKGVLIEGNYLFKAMCRVNKSAINNKDQLGRTLLMHLYENGVKSLVSYQKLIEQSKQSYDLGDIIHRENANVLMGTLRLYGMLIDNVCNRFNGRMEIYSVSKTGYSSSEMESDFFNEIEKSITLSKEILTAYWNIEGIRKENRTMHDYDMRNLSSLKEVFNLLNCSLSSMVDRQNKPFTKNKDIDSYIQPWLNTL